MSNDFKESVDSNSFMPQNERARMAVEKARAIVRQNNELVDQIKQNANIKNPNDHEDVFCNAQNFKVDDAHAFELYKIRSSNVVKDFFRGIFGVH